MKRQEAKAWLLSGALLCATAAPLAPAAMIQHGNDHGGGTHGNVQGNRGNQGGHNNYYSGMQNNVRGGGYDQRYGHNDRGRHDSGGGIGPGYGALIGGGGGAALGAIFGGGLKGTLIGGAAGAGLGALGGKLAQGNDNHHDYHHR